MLELDERQEYQNSARKIAQMIKIQWDALAEADLPEYLALELMKIWLESSMRPQIPEFPDLSKLFPTSDDG